MGYQDGAGLRPGRTKEKFESSVDRGSAASTFAPRAGGFRATLAPPPVAVAPKEKPANAGSASSALSQISAGPEMPSMPKPPGLGSQILGAVGTRVASDLAGSAVKAGTSALGDAFGLLTDSSMGPLDIAGVSVGDALPYAGSAIKLAQGDAKGAAFSAAGTYIGNIIAPGVGGFIGGAVGGAVGGMAPGKGSIGSSAGSALGCFITEATMVGLGVQDDNAEPLMVLRWFRDNVLSGTPQGQQMIQEYEAIAPLVVRAIEERPDAKDVFRQLFEQFIAPSVEAVKTGNYPQALQIYAAMIAAVTPLAQQAMGDEDEADSFDGEMQEASESDDEMEAVGSMGEHAQQVAVSPNVAHQAAPMQGGSALHQIMAPDDYPTPVRFGRE